MQTHPADQLLADKLRAGGHRVTSQRLVIHRELYARKQHVTADQLLDAVLPALPGIAIPTVYATLVLLEDLGLVRRVSTGTGAVVFDSHVEPHAHTICRGCGTLADLDGHGSHPDALRAAAASGFSPDHAQVLIWGLCADCRLPPGS
ncbi:MAG TPA: Fur family transcriptional regulator [Solirubrobacteraceae bacterium]|jgi:Fe2+ or Zn2+ uptake regulation protein|nr:Fur family transcriptional regulator [Solirubrobacteraceae bacterium]